MGFSLRFEGGTMRIFNSLNQERVFFPMDELPPSELQNLH